MTIKKLILAVLFSTAFSQLTVAQNFYDTNTDKERLLGTVIINGVQFSTAWVFGIRETVPTAPTGKRIHSTSKSIM